VVSSNQRVLSGFYGKSEVPHEWNIVMIVKINLLMSTSAQATELNYSDRIAVINKTVCTE